MTHGDDFTFYLSCRFGRRVHSLRRAALKYSMRGGGRIVKIDLHMHSDVSDGTDSPIELIEKVKAVGIGVFSVTDHDAVKSGRIIRGSLKCGDPGFITGAEFSCRDENGKYHILGYGFDPDNREINALADRAHALRMKKVTERLDFLKSEFDFVFPEDEIGRLLSLDNPGKPHIGNLMVKYGYAETKEEAISRFIDKKRFKSEYLSPGEAICAILASGAVPVLAHPFYGSGDELIVGDEMDARLRRLIDYGLKGIEAFYSGFSDKLQNNALSLADRYDLFVTAGSDYHGENKLVKLGDTGLSAESELPLRLKRFLEFFDI